MEPPETHPEPGYLLQVLADSIRPFRYRSAVHELLGISDPDLPAAKPIRQPSRLTFPYLNLLTGNAPAAWLGDAVPDPPTYRPVNRPGVEVEVEWFDFTTPEVVTAERPQPDPRTTPDVGQRRTPAASPAAPRDDAPQHAPPTAVSRPQMGDRSHLPATPSVSERVPASAIPIQGESPTSALHAPPSVSSLQSTESAGVAASFPAVDQLKAEQSTDSLIAPVPVTITSHPVPQRDIAPPRAGEGTEFAQRAVDSRREPQAVAPLQQQPTGSPEVVSHTTGSADRSAPQRSAAGVIRTVEADAPTDFSPQPAIFDQFKVDATDAAVHFSAFPRGLPDTLGISAVPDAPAAPDPPEHPPALMRTGEPTRRHTAIPAMNRAAHRVSTGATHSPPDSPPFEATLPAAGDTAGVARRASPRTAVEGRSFQPRRMPSPAQPPEEQPAEEEPASPPLPKSSLVIVQPRQSPNTESGPTLARRYFNRNQTRFRR